MSYTLFHKHIFFLGQRQYASGFPNFSLILCLQYTWNSRNYIKVGTWTFVWRSNILCTFILRHLFKIYKTVSILLAKTLIFLFMFFVSFFLSIFGNFDVFLHMLILAIREFWLMWDVITFAKFAEFLKGSTVRGGRDFLIFQPKDMVN